jgi:hypothetical protein
MRQQILEILEQIRIERGDDDGVQVIVYEQVAELLNILTACTPKLDGYELLMAVRDARSVMLDILLRLRDESVERTDRRTELEADKFWDASMREHFVEDAEKLAAKPEVRDLYREVHEEEDQPINDFLNQIDQEVDQDLGMFVYNMLTSDAEKATL